MFSGFWIRVAFPEGVKRGGHAPNRSETCTFAPRNSPREPNLHFVQIFELTVRWFTPPFACFGRSRPPDTPALKASTCTNAYYCGGNMPASMAMRGLGRCANVPEPSPQTSPTARFHTAATAASLRAAPCAHMRAQLSASEPRLVPVHEPRGRTRAEERAARHLTLHAAAGAAQAPRAMAAGHLRGSGRAARTSP